MGGKPASTGPTKLNQISVQSSTLGVPLTIGWGRGRVKCNLIWYGGFQAIAHKSKQAGGKGLGGGGSTTDYSYTASVILALGEGQIGGINTVYRDKSTFTGATALADCGLSLANGAQAQPTWGYLTSHFPAQALNYSGMAYVYAQDYALGDNATLPNHSFEVDFAVQLGGGVHDADPKDIVSDFLTNANAGLPGWPAGLIGDLSDWSRACRANNLLLSPVIDSQRQASDFLGEIMKATNSDAVWSEGQLKIASYGDAPASANGVDWTPDLTPRYDLTEDDLIPDDGKPVKLEIVDQSDAYNMVQVEYLDRANQYNTAIAPAQDLANIVQYGRRKQDPTTLHSICDATIAQNAAQLLLQRTLYMRETYSFTLPWNFARLEPMIDTVTLTTTTDELRLDRKQVRITGIEEDEDGNLAITAIGMDIGVASAAQYNAHSGSGYAPNLDISPGPVSAPILINAPTSLTGGTAEIWCAVASSNPNWGGCEVWISADDIEYQRVGAIVAAARIGVSTGPLASHADPDTANTLSVDLSASAGQLASSTAPNANAGATLCLIGTELVAYQTATLTAAWHYDLTTLRRGLYGTAVQSHAAGQSFARLDDAVFKFGYGALSLGSTVYVKLPSYNVFGRAIEDLAALAAYTVQLSPNVTVGTGSLGAYTLVNRENCFVDGRTITKITGSNGWGDGSVVSQESFIGGCFCGFQPLQTNAYIMVGLNADPATDDSYASLDFAWYVDGVGNAYPYESGAPVAGPFAYAAGDVFMVRYDGAAVSYLQSGAVRHVTTGIASTLQLYLDTAFATVGGKVTNLTFAGTGIQGISAPLLTLSSTAQTFTYDGTGAAAPSGQTITLTAQLQNVTGTASFTATLYDAANGSLGAAPLGGSGNSRTLAIGDFSAAAYAIVTATLGGLSDQETIVRLRNGSSAIAALLTNESATVAADSAGTVASFAGAGGSMLLYRGSTLLTGGVSYSVAAASGVTIAIDGGGAYSIAALSADQGVATLRATYAGVDYDKVYNISKSRAGVAGANGANGVNGTNGTNGTDGANAPLLEIEYSGDGSSWHGTYAGSDVYMRLSADGGATWGNAQLIRGGDVTYAWARSAGTPAAPPSAPGSNDRPPAGWYAADPGGAGLLWMTFARFGGDGYNYTGWNPPVQVEGVNGANGANGANGLSASISPAALTIPCTSDGTPKSGLPASAQIALFDGAIDVRASASYAITNTNCTATVNATGQVSITALSDDHALAVVTVNYGGVTLQPSISIAKARDGSAGGAGAAPYSATRIDTMGTTSYAGTVVVANGQTVTLNAIAIIFAGGGSPTVTLTAQYSLDGSAFIDMGGDYTSTVTILHNDTDGPGVAGTYTNTSGATQVVSFRVLLTNVGGTPSVQGGSYMQPSVA
ncbi:phage tail protein [Sphingomonas sp. MMS24-J13]|uniref:phage tail protein n=1 Tax=Sphingomonas sp. MMS24-J13 TaxID=3238686 RepID=UPI0038515A0E